MIEYITPSGKNTKPSLREALDHCEAEAGAEAKRSTKIYSKINSSDSIHISCNGKKWTISLKNK